MDPNSPNVLEIAARRLERKHSSIDPHTDDAGSRRNDRANASTADADRSCIPARKEGVRCDAVEWNDAHPGEAPSSVYSHSHSGTPHGFSRSDITPGQTGLRNSHSQTLDVERSQPRSRGRRASQGRAQNQSGTGVQSHQSQQPMVNNRYDNDDRRRGVADHPLPDAAPSSAGNRDRTASFGAASALAALANVVVHSAPSSDAGQGGDHLVHHEEATEEPETPGLHHGHYQDDVRREEEDEMASYPTPTVDLTLPPGGTPAPSDSRTFTSSGTGPLPRPSRASNGGGKRDVQRRRRRARGCGECPECLQEDCRACVNCLDMKKYGGPNKIRQRCMNRKMCSRVPDYAAAQEESYAKIDASMESTGRRRRVRAKPKTLEEEQADDVARSRRKAKDRAGDVVEGAVQTQPVMSQISEAAAEEMKRLRENPFLDALSDAPSSTEFYEEESAWRFHNPPQPPPKVKAGPELEDVASNSGDASALNEGDKKLEKGRQEPVATADLKPLPLAPPLPEFPDTGYCRWSFDETTRVLLADFCFGADEGEVQIVYEDEKFLLHMMERDDLTVVSEGLVDNLNPSLWNLEYIKGCAGNEYYHKFRGFKRVVKRGKEITIPAALQSSADTAGKPGEDGDKPKQLVEDETNSDEQKCFVTHREMDKCFAMNVSDYIRYIEKRQTAIENIASRRLEAGRDPVNPSDLDDIAFGRTSATNPDDGVIENEEKEIGEETKTGQDGARLDSAPDGGNTEEGKKEVDEGSGQEEAGTDSVDEELFEFTDDNGKIRKINVVDVVLYMIDFDMVKLLPTLYEDFARNFKLPGCVPGGTHCMMNAVNVGGRPFMGPNLYITPPASFTHFHQDGHGTVDSGHQCLSGYNEVVMLRRLTERHKMHALYLLNGGSRKKQDSQYDALYGLPHGDGHGEKPMWPDVEAIRQCRDMNYYPSVFVLKPGQFVHINKGRLHAFRKLAPSILSARDCHAKLRSSIIEQDKLGNKEHICMSVAWDWMYRGVTSEGTNREVASILECARLNRKNAKQSLAIPETCLLKLAQSLLAKHSQDAAEDTANHSSCLPYLSKRSIRESDASKASSKGGANPSTECRTLPFMPAASTVLKGILPSLQYIVNRHMNAVQRAEEKEQQQQHSPSERVSIHPKPNSWENPELFSLDPYGNSDFFCKLCSEELSNVYMHCDGCEKILNKDFNICVSCHSEGRYKMRVQMHPLNTKRHSTINHTGDFRRLNQSRCPCRNGPVCLNCTFCAGCSCRCHQWFTLHYRFIGIANEIDLLKQAKDVIGLDMLACANETSARLFSMSSVDLSEFAHSGMNEENYTEEDREILSLALSQVRQNEIQSAGGGEEEYYDQGRRKGNSAKKTKKKRNGKDNPHIRKDIVWECHMCQKHNTMERLRCQGCRAWKGGKRGLSHGDTKGCKIITVGDPTSKNEDREDREGSDLPPSSEGEGEIWRNMDIPPKNKETTGRSKKRRKINTATSPTKKDNNVWTDDGKVVSMRATKRTAAVSYATSQAALKIMPKTKKKGSKSTIVVRDSAEKNTPTKRDRRTPSLLRQAQVAADCSGRSGGTRNGKRLKFDQLHVAGASQSTGDCHTPVSGDKVSTRRTCRTTNSAKAEMSSLTKKGPEKNNSDFREDILWECHKCQLHNSMRVLRCQACRAWKGGKRGLTRADTAGCKIIESPVK